MKNLLLLTGVLLASGCAEKNCSQAFEEQEIEHCLELVAEEALQLHQGASLTDPEAMLPGAHPYLYLTHAIALVRENKIKQGAFWYIAGTLRYSFYLRSHPHLEQSGEATLFESLSSSILSIRPEFNAFIYSEDGFDVADKLLEWDSSTPNGFVSKTQFNKAWNEARDYLKSREKRLRLFENVE